MTETPYSKRRPRVLAVASGGGHWVQLMRLRPVLLQADTAFVTVSRLYQPDVLGNRFYVVPDATRWNPFRLVLAGLQLLWIILRERPARIITTGAAPGFLAIRIGRIFGARTCWLDSIANVEQLSLSGQKAGKYSDLWLTQWPELATEKGPKYRGSVL
ncbi:MAG: hypothetical protein AB7O54_08370 [Pseudomonadales bacterium]